MSNNQNISGKNFRSHFSPLQLVVVCGHIHNVFVVVVVVVVVVVLLLLS